MDYEIVNLKEKTLAGLSARTNNASPEMEKIIGGLWEKFYSPEIYPKIKNKADDKALGVYSDYDSDENGDYTVSVMCRVTGAETLPEGTESRKIPAGKYAKFVVKGNMITAVREFWQKLWKTELNRAYICDFEEYQNADTENAEIHIYISLC